MTTTNTDNHKLSFEVQTYNGISIIRETTSGYVNASRMCSDNNKKWRSFTTTKFWKNKVDAFKRSSFYKNSEVAQIWASSFLAKRGVKPEFQGEYIHPKLVHIVAEWCDDDYAFAVAELMDNINVTVHKVLEEKNLPDTPKNAKPIFELTREEMIRRNMEKSWQEELDRIANEKLDGCWGYRD